MKGMRKAFLFTLSIILIVQVCTSCHQISTPQPDNIEETSRHTDYPKASPLSKRELAYFNKEFFNQFPSISNLFLTSVYNSPKDIDFSAFCLYGIGASLNIDKDEMENAIGANFFVKDQAHSVLKFTVTELDAILTKFIGMSLSETAGIGLDSFTYLSNYDAYYLVIDKVFNLPNINFISGDRIGNIVRLYYDASSLFSDIIFNPNGSSDNYSACVTLQETCDGYRFISNQFVPIAVEHLATDPMFVISLAELSPYSVSKISTEHHSNDCSYLYAKESLDSADVCVYISTDGQAFVALLHNAIDWNAEVFFKLPDRALGPGFSFGALNLFGQSGIRLSYEQNNKKIYKYYLLTDDGAPFLLATCNGPDSIADLDKNGENELVIYNDGLPTLFFQQDNSFFSADIASFIKDYWTDTKNIRFKSLDVLNSRIPLYEEAIGKNGFCQQTEAWYLYFYNNSLLLYKNLNS